MAGLAQGDEVFGAMRLCALNMMHTKIFSGTTSDALESITHLDSQLPLVHVKGFMAGFPARNADGVRVDAFTWASFAHREV